MKKVELLSFIEVLEQHEDWVNFFIHKLGIYDQYGEYYQEGLVALWNAYNIFDTSQGAFHTYANNQIEIRLAEMKLKNSGRFSKDKFLVEVFNGDIKQTLTDSPKSQFLWEKVQSRMMVNRWKWFYSNILMDHLLKRDNSLRTMESWDETAS
ncbi:hypothetical protein [Virgibacillus doumboii]|uniref:hypothetical protein n=1 Tax=Virgibacillus doumboii TaxID=2697503 RepID=UPI0013DEF4BC|nr:hypothetical protein [Virgibacillus doumboii]